MPNDTILRDRIRGALVSTPAPSLDLAAVHRRAENPQRPAAAAPRKRQIAAVALAIAIPAVAFAATPESLIRATLQHLAVAYFGPTTASHLAGALPNASQQRRIMKAIEHPISLADAVRAASHDFHVQLPKRLPAGAKAMQAIYAGGTLSYGYRLQGGGELGVTVKRATAENSKTAQKLDAFTARFSKDGRLIRSARVNIVRFAVADEIIDFQSARLSEAQLATIGKAMGGRELGRSQ